MVNLGGLVDREDESDPVRPVLLSALQAGAFSGTYHPQSLHIASWVFSFFFLLCTK